MSETPDTPTRYPDCPSTCRGHEPPPDGLYSPHKAETPDTPSTEALAPDPHIGCQFRHEHRFPECYDDVAASGPPPRRVPQVTSYEHIIEQEKVLAHQSCLGCGAAGDRGPTFCSTHGDWLCERCVRAVRQEAADTSGHRLIFAAASAVNSEPMLYCSCGVWQWTTAVRDVDLSHFRGQEAADTSGLRETVSEVAKALYAWGNVESSGRATSYARALATALEGATDE